MSLAKFLKKSSVVTSSVLISAALITAPAFAQTTDGGDGGSSGGVSSVETMVGDLDGVADDAFPIAVGVTGFAVAALLIKRVLYA